MDQPLITIDDARKIRNIPQTYPQGEFDSLVREIQRVHVEKLLGYDLYNDLLSNLTKQNYIDLLNGTTYTKNPNVIQDSTFSIDNGSGSEPASPWSWSPFNLFTITDGTLQIFSTGTITQEINECTKTHQLKFNVSDLQNPIDEIDLASGFIGNIADIPAVDDMIKLEVVGSNDTTLEVEIDMPSGLPAGKIDNFTIKDFSKNILRFRGLKDYIAYLFFYYYTKEGDVSYTNSGTKNYGAMNSIPANSSLQQGVINQHWDRAESISKEILDFLETEKLYYPKFNTSQPDITVTERSNFKVHGSNFSRSKIII